MGFKCHFCNKHIEGEQEHKVTTKEREVTYQNGSVFSKGTEIVNEESACTKCIKEGNYPEPMTVPSEKIVKESEADGDEQESYEDKYNGA